jgi:3-isopropylmalate/(R)-2-methylmalate dehydratase large subunit
MLREMGARIWDPSKVVIVSDHYTPASDPEGAALLKLTRDFAREHGLLHFDAVGICHTVLPENGLIRPGAFIAGGDSHTPTAGAFGAYAAGYGATDMAAIAATGRTWLSVPATVRLELDGVPSLGVTAKDMMLMLLRRLGMDNSFKAIEFAGAAVEAMSMSERMVLCNMAAELGAETGVVAPDETTFDYLAKTGRPVEDAAAALALASDPDADYEARRGFDVSVLEPQIAAPHAPENSGPVSAYLGVEIDQAYIGACVGAKLSDIAMAAAVLRGRRVAAGKRLILAPASSAVTAAAAKSGDLAVLLEAGATLLGSGCGACAGYGGGLLADGEVCISTTNRNFKGRMGSAEASVYLASPFSVAAAAVAGRIVDPRPLLRAAA